MIRSIALKMLGVLLICCMLVIPATTRAAPLAKTVTNVYAFCSTVPHILVIVVMYSDGTSKVGTVKVKGCA